jgi:hypothetical protein
MKQQLEQFKVKLQSFAEKHRHQIAKDPQFRKHFNELCAKVGVDPLACTHYLPTKKKTNINVPNSRGVCLFFLRSQ